MQWNLTGRIIKTVECEIHIKEKSKTFYHKPKFKSTLLEYLEKCVMRNIYTQKNQRGSGTCALLRAILETIL